MYTFFHSAYCSFHSSYRSSGSPVHHRSNIEIIILAWIIGKILNSDNSIWNTDFILFYVVHSKRSMLSTKCFRKNEKWQYNSETHIYYVLMRYILGLIEYLNANVILARCSGYWIQEPAHEVHRDNIQATGWSRAMFVRCLALVWSPRNCSAHNCLEPATLPTWLIWRHTSELYGPNTQRRFVDKPRFMCITWRVLTRFRPGTN